MNMEFEILNGKEIVELPQVRWNFEELKKYAQEKALEYKSIAYTDKDVSAMKSDRADINRFIKAVEAERIEKKKQYMAPYAIFEGQVKEVLQPLKEAEALIAKGLKEIDDKWKDERKADIRTLYDALIGDLKDVLAFEDILDEAYLKKSTSLKKVEDSLVQYLDMVKSDTAELYALPEQYQAAALRAYKTSGRNLSAALTEVRRIQEEEKLIEERKRQAEKAKAISEEIAKNRSNQAEQAAKPEAETKTDAEPILQLDFRVYGTREQILALRDFMVAKNIKFGRLKG